LIARSPIEASLQPAPASGLSAPGGGADGSRVEVLHGLAAAVRGLSAIFWGLPLALLAFARHFLVLWPTLYDLIFPTMAALLLLFGVHMLGRLHPRERIWQRAVLCNELLGLALVGLAPFLFFWSRAPSEPYFARAVLFLVVAAFAFIVSLTRTLVRLSAMLPDDIARGDARLFHALSSYVVAVLVCVGIVLYLRLAPIPLSEFLSLPRQPFGFGRQALLLLLVLVPVAMAMAVAWKLKEVAMAVVMGAKA
jgi:hypothetical protein